MTVREATSVAKQEHVVFVSLVQENEDRSLTNTLLRRTCFRHPLLNALFYVYAALP